MTNEFDLLVVGGGINGAGIARDAAGRGLRVMLCEQHDFAAHTSSASTKLIHGGLRYLEQFHFGLVRKALAEREVLLAAAPHIIYPLRFVMPHAPHLRPAWLIRCGLFLYDHLASRKSLPASVRLDLRTHPAGAPLADSYHTGFAYYDAWVDDARLVVLNAMAAREQGAVVSNYCRVAGLRAAGGQWIATLERSAGSKHDIAARAVVNATGPWAAQFRGLMNPTPSEHGLRLVKGSHIVVRRLFEHDDAYIFQANDKRIVFAIPYEQDFTLIGTTDVDYRGAPDAVAIDSAEIDYLCSQVSAFFRLPVKPADVLTTYSGVRPLLAGEGSDARTTSRDYQLEFTSAPAPALQAFGGKLTTYRVLAEQAVDVLARALGTRAPGWTAGTPLPGGDLGEGGLAAFQAQLASEKPFVAQAVLRRWVRAYGTRCRKMLAKVESLADLGSEILPGLYAVEVQYLRREEYACTAQDILTRRSKLALHLPAEASQKLQRWMLENPS